MFALSFFARAAPVFRELWADRRQVNHRRVKSAAPCSLSPRCRAPKSCSHLSTVCS